MPVYRVDMKTKSNKGAGSRGHCVECNHLTNLFCIIYKKWLCNPQLAANQNMLGSKLDADANDYKYIKIEFDDGAISGKEETICYLCHILMLAQVSPSPFGSKWSPRTRMMLL